MSEISKQVANRIAWARFVVSSCRIHGEPVKAVLAQLYDGIDGFDGTQFGEVMDTAAARLGTATDEMRAAELALAAELSDDDEHRGRRDEVVEQLREELFAGRDVLERGLGEGAASAYGLSSAPPRRPDALLAFAENVINLLQETPESGTDVFGNAVETAAIASSLEQSHARLEAALDQIDQETRKAQQARAARDEVVDQWAEVYRGTATVLSGLFLLAGRRDLADRVRPTIRGTAGKSEPPEDVDDTVDGQGEDDVPADNADVVDEPAEV
jgi:hypothetical protein